MIEFGRSAVVHNFLGHLEKNRLFKERNQNPQRKFTFSVGFIRVGRLWSILFCVKIFKKMNLFLGSYV
ncbi:hypothetical protein BHL37_10890 [Bacillus cereus]|nr:hypothetical protein BHL37_10890 [Bacillus cereus]